MSRNAIPSEEERAGATPGASATRSRRQRHGTKVPTHGWSMRAFLAAFLAAGIGASGMVFAQAPSCHIEYATMHDGVQLATEVYLPATAGPYPVVMQRTPYNRNGAAQDTSCSNATLMDYASNGYAALNQDVRGMYRSLGAFNAMQQEVKDGYNAVEWAARQPWSNGKVGMFSGSYVGLTQWQAADRSPPHLAAISPNITASDYHDNWTYVNGVFDLWFAQSWIAVTFGKETLLRQLLATGMSRDDANAKVAAWDQNAQQSLLTDWVWQLPLSDFPEYRSLAPYYYTWLDHPNYDALWKRIDVEPRYRDVKVPVLNAGAWYDIFQVGTFENFRGMKSRGGTNEARKGTKLVVTCCGHAGTSGAVKWGPNPTPMTTDLRFFDHYLKGIDNGVEDDPAVQLYVLDPPDTGTQGSGFWVTADRYPLPGTQEKNLFLSSGGDANSNLGDGQLVATPVRAADRHGKHDGNDGDWHGGPHDRFDDDSHGSVPDRFDYDPNNPVPTVGGNMCCNTVLLPAGAHDQSVVEGRNDVLVYTSDPLTKDLPVVGPVNVVLWAATSARDTDFTAKLVDVHVDGFAHNVLDRVVRARFRAGSKEAPTPIRPFVPYEYTIFLGHAGTVFRKGHRIRLEISSSNFPHYARNLNTGLDNATTAQAVVAHQVVLHDREHRSRLVLPIAPGVLSHKP